MERVTKLSLHCSKTDYLKCQHRTFIQQLIEAEADIYSRALGCAPKVQFKKGKSENMSKDVKNIIGIATEIGYLN